MRANYKAGRCEHCKTQVGAGQGAVFQREGAWKVACRSAACHRALGLDAEEKRMLTAEGLVRMPYAADAIPLLRSMPGARWNPQQKSWTVSLELGDRARLLELADQLSLEVDPALRVNVAAPDTRAASQRAQAAGAYDFQCTGVEFLASRTRALLADDMGLGKTLQALMALPEEGYGLVVCPASLKFNWRAEIQKWRPELKARVLEGKQTDVRALLPSAGEVVIVNYDILPASLRKPKADASAATQQAYEAMLATLKPALSCTVVILDEAHRGKNHKAQRTQALHTLCEVAERVWLLTGTPVENKPIELWGVLSTGDMEREVFGSWSGFARCFRGYKEQVSRTQSKWTFDGPTPEAAERLRRVMLRRKKTEVLKELPPKQYRDLVTDGLSTSMRKELDTLWKEWGDEDDSQSALPSFTDMSRIRAQLAQARIPALLEYVEDHEEQGVPLVVFSAHRAPIDELAKREGWVVITGDMSAAARQEVVRRFQAGECKGIGLTIGAGREGLTLTYASNLLFVDRSWNPSENAQAEDRICRIGQKSNSVLITSMVSDHPLDRRVQELLGKKQRMIEMALEGRVIVGAPEGPQLVEESDAAALSRRQAYEAALAEAERQEARDWVAERLEREVTRSGGGGKLPELSSERKATIRQALSLMLSMCDGAQNIDGQGFNKPDAAIMHQVGRTGLLDADDTTFRVADCILRRYPRQLQGSFPELWE